MDCQMADRKVDQMAAALGKTLVELLVALLVCCKVLLWASRWVVLSAPLMVVT